MVLVRFVCLLCISQLISIFQGLLRHIYNYFVTDLEPETSQPNSPISASTSTLPDLVPIYDEHGKSKLSYWTHLVKSYLGRLEGYRRLPNNARHPRNQQQGMYME